MTPQDLIARLHTNRLMETFESVEAFEASIAALADHSPSADWLPELFAAFDDACPYHAVMWELVTFVENIGEQVGSDIYLRALCDAALDEQSGGWIGGMLLRVINTEGTRLALKALLPTLPDPTYEAVRNLLHILAYETPGLDETQEAEIEARIASVLGDE